MNLAELKQEPIAELLEVSDAMGLESMARSRKQNIIFALLKKRAKSGEEISGDGVLEILQNGFDFLRSVDSPYLAGPDDIYVLSNQIRRFNLRTGDTIIGKIRLSEESEHYSALPKAGLINFDHPENAKNKVLFGGLTPLFPDERMKMEAGSDPTEGLAGRVIDLCAPIDRGQRGPIVMPSKTSETIMLQNVASNIARNNPECHLTVLLIDEHPEEVTGVQRTVCDEVAASTFDKPPTRHIRVTEMVIEKAKRLVEHKKDVVILLDSTIHLARTYNTVIPNSGKVLTDGVDVHALEKSKRFFDAARNIEEGGSLTILATALMETGSKMDEVIYEELKGTGDMELPLDRKIVEKRVLPAININRSGTRHEELLASEDELQHMRVLRRALHPMDEISAIEFLIDGFKRTRVNDELFDSMKRK